MNTGDIFHKVKSIMMTEFELDGDLILPEKRLYDDLDLDSLDAVDLVVSLKEHIEGAIDPALFKNARTVGDVIAILAPIWKSA